MATREAPQADSVFWKLWEVGTSGHVALYKLTRGRLGGRSNGLPVALLEHVGRRSGKHRTSPLLCLPDGDNLIVVASKGGIDKHPAWYLNLTDSPETDVWWQGRKRHVRARVAEGKERERLWKLMADGYPGYEDYQARTERQIPVVVLEPA